MLNKLAKGIFGVEGVAEVQGVTRPEGTPLQHTSLPFLLSIQNAGLLQNMTFVKDRLEDMRKQAEELAGTTATLDRTYALLQQLADTTHHSVGATKKPKYKPTAKRMTVTAVNHGIIFPASG